MRYRTPAALEMAVKATAKASPLDTNLAISAFISTGCCAVCSAKKIANSC